MMTRSTVIGRLSGDYLDLIALDEASAQRIDELCARCRRRHRLVGHTRCWNCRDLEIDLLGNDDGEQDDR